MVTFTELVVWVLIAAVVTFIVEHILHRQALDAILGSIVLAVIGLFLIVGILHFHIPGEPDIAGVPLVTAIIVSAIAVAIWSAFFYTRYYRPYASRYYPRRGVLGRRR